MWTFKQLYHQFKGRGLKYNPTSQRYLRTQATTTARIRCHHTHTHMHTHDAPPSSEWICFQLFTLSQKSPLRKAFLKLTIVRLCCCVQPLPLKGHRGQAVRLSTNGMTQPIFISSAPDMSFPCYPDLEFLHLCDVIIGVF